MPIGEFDLIHAYFRDQGPRRPDTRLGIGDDCALLRPRPEMDLAVTVDTLVAGVHFLDDTNPEGLGHKALAVNLSDLAAMGAEPAWVTLALTLPHIDESWLSAFAKGFFGLATDFGVALVGGDTTLGPMSITVQAMGWVPESGALRRSTAQAGDDVYITGDLGLAGLGLQVALGKLPAVGDAAMARLLRPEPRVAAGLALRGIASSCIDISDGLVADLGHILEESDVGATLRWEALPLPTCVNDYIAKTGDWQLPLSAGDDYELCFTVAPDREPALQAKLHAMTCPVTRIGTIERSAGLRLRRCDEIMVLSTTGYQHFKS